MNVVIQTMYVVKQLWKDLPLMGLQSQAYSGTELLPRLPAHDFKTGGGTMSGTKGTFVVDSFVTATEAFLRTLVGCAGPVCVDGAFRLGNGSEDTNVILEDFDKAPGYCQRRGGPAPRVGEPPNRKLRKHRCVAGKDSQVAVQARHDNLPGLRLDDSPVGRHNRKCEPIVHDRYAFACISSAFWSTSSIVPTM